jgi:hypothetical protein
MPTKEQTTEQKSQYAGAISHEALRKLGLVSSKPRMREAPQQSQSQTNVTEKREKSERKK